MPENKLQHYVPRCYLRPFCADASGAAINLFNVDRRMAVRNAPTKGQCARNYLYGQDGELERALQGPEGRYAAKVRQAIEDPRSLTKADLAELRTLMLFQTFRSFGYLEKLIAMSHRHDADLLRSAGGDESSVQQLKMDIPMAVMMSLKHFFDMQEHVADLDSCLVVNASRAEFVTSDDPAIHTNRFHFQKRLPGGFGFGSSGSMLFMPITPRLLLMSFDPHVYFVPGRAGDTVTIRHDRHVADLNELQFLHARHNLYFARWSDQAEIASTFAQHAGRRPTVWHEFMYFRKDAESERGEHYVRVESTELSAREEHVSMFHQVHVRPDRWSRVLNYKLKSEVVDTGTGAGHVRPSHPLLKRLR